MTPTQIFLCIGAYLMVGFIFLGALHKDGDSNKTNYVCVLLWPMIIFIMIGKVLALALKELADLP